MQGIGSGKVLQSGPNDNVFINFDVCCRHHYDTSSYNHRTTAARA